jgi:hypothetical protein
MIMNPMVNIEHKEHMMIVSISPKLTMFENEFEILLSLSVEFVGVYEPPDELELEFTFIEDADEAVLYLLFNVTRVYWFSVVKPGGWLLQRNWYFESKKIESGTTSLQL